MLSTLLMNLYDAATERAERAFRALPKALRSQDCDVLFSPKYSDSVGFFLPREIPAHLIQSESLALGFIQAKLKGVPFELVGPLADIAAILDPVEKHKQLSALNLRGAQELSAKFLNYDALIEKWLDRRASFGKIFGATRDAELVAHVAHPLVELEGSIFEIAIIMFVEHSDYHLGQFTQLMKCGRAAERVPFPFGKIVSLAAQGQ